MSAASLSLPAIIFAGSALAIDRSTWGILVAIAVLILAGGAILVTLRQRFQSKNKTPEQRTGGVGGPGQKISSGLITLSSAAILAIYAAGYHRTGSAAEKFDLQASRHRPAQIPAQVLTPVPVTPGIAILSGRACAPALYEKIRSHDIALGSKIETGACGSRCPGRYVLCTSADDNFR